MGYTRTPISMTLLRCGSAGYSNTDIPRVCGSSAPMTLSIIRSRIGLVLSRAMGTSGPSIEKAPIVKQVFQIKLFSYLA